MSYTAERRQEEKEQRRNEIIDAAEAVFARKGRDKATMADIARQARLSRGLIYFYFEDKEDLYLAIIHRSLQALRTSFERALERHRDEPGLLRFRAIGEAYVRFSSEQPEYFDALARFEARDLDLEEAVANEQACLSEFQRVHRLMAAAVQAGIDDGSIRADVGDPMAVSVTMWGFMHGLIQVVSKKEALLQTFYDLDLGKLQETGFDLAGNALMPRS